MKLEVGMYVRTETGQIGKITNFDGSMARVDTDKFITYKNFNSEITKASHSIIDLVQVGDYVNGELVVAIHKNYVCDEIKLGTALETACNYTATLNEDIKSIVTKEMFSSMEYRLGDD